MLCMMQPKINYDSQFDILDYMLQPDAESYGDEEIDQIVIFRDFDTDEVTGYKIFNFKKICQEKSELYSIISSYFDVEKVTEQFNI